MTVDPYAVLLGSRARLFPTFDAHQAEGAQELVQAVEGVLRGGEVSTILEIGCGTGEVLRHFGASEFTKGIQLLGLDISQAQIEEARRLDEPKHIKWVLGSATSLGDIFDDLDWSKTLVMCVGHTLPHFVDWDGFKNFLSQRRPRFLLCDIHHSWDLAVKEVELDQSVHREVSGHSSDGAELLVLYTRSSEAGRVERGIEEFRNGEFRRLVWTQQLQVKSADFMRDIELAGYVPGKRFEYRSGYGRMKAVLCSRIHEDADLLNDLYFTILKDRLPTIFKEDHIKDAMESFRVRLLAAILPFDSHHVLARYVSVVDSVTAPTDEMLVAPPDRNQARYPIAAGLYSTLLGPVSAPTVLRLAANEQKASQRDIEFGLREADFFKRIGDAVDPSDSDPDRSYFVAPVYWGTWPLFCLVAKFAKGFPDASTEPEVYGSLIKNALRRVEAQLRQTDATGGCTEFELNILRPLVFGAVQRLSANGRMSLDRARDKIDLMLGALTPVEAERAESDPTSRAWPDRRWKSWLLTMPSWPVAGLRSVRDQNQELARLRAKALDDACHNTLTIISDWFRTGEFFELDAHEVWDPAKHLPKLAKMLNCVGVTLDALPACSYYEAIVESPEWRWVATELKSLAVHCGCPNQCSCERKQTSFKRLKALLCRTEANMGEQYRFSALRLCTLLRLSHPNLELIDVELLTSAILVEGDRSDSFQRLFAVLRNVSAAKVTGTLPVSDEQFDQTYTVAIDFHTPWSPVGTKGEKYRRLSKAVDELTGQSNVWPVIANGHSLVRGLDLTFSLRVYQNVVPAVAEPDRGQWLRNGDRFVTIGLR